MYQLNVLCKLPQFYCAQNAASNSSADDIFATDMLSIMQS